MQRKCQLLMGASPFEGVSMKWGRFCLATVVLVQVQNIRNYAYAFGATINAQNPVAQINNSLFPIQTIPASGNSVDDLFPTQPRINPTVIQPGTLPPPVATPNNNPPGIVPPVSNNNPQGGTPGVVNPQAPRPNVPGQQPLPGTQPTQGTQAPGMPNNNGMPNNGIPGQQPGFRSADTKPEFRCNIFENADVIDVLSALNSLNQAVGSVSCGNKTINVQTVQDNNKKISDAIKAMNGYLQTPSTIRPEDSSAIVNNVDVAIRAANALATTFASSDLLDKDCRGQMSTGDVALALNDVINGLTPFALMAATMTGGTAAIPFIVGGSEITGALNSVNKIIMENAVKIRDSQVRRAVVENTCQFIRLDQKYKFLIKNREEQISQILNEITSSQSLFSANIHRLSGVTNSLVDKKNALNTAALEVENQLSAAKSQLAIDKTFIASTSDELKICQMGIQLATMTTDNISYVATMLGSVDSASTRFGASSTAQARSLKVSGQIAVKSLKDFSSKIFNIGTDFSVCAKATKSFVETIEQSAVLASQIVKSAQEKLDKDLKASPDFDQMQGQLNAINQKQLQAERITGSLDNLRQFANSFAQSEIDSELDRLRKSLFGQRVMGQNSPVMAWFDYVQGLHKASLTKFKEGMQALRLKAYSMTKSGNNPTNVTFEGLFFNLKNVNKDWEDAYKFKQYDLDTLRIGSKEYNDACREMSDVWNRWVVTIDHLQAIEAFCTMIDGYIYDNRLEDRQLVQMCRGKSVSPGMATYFGNQSTNATLQQLKDIIIKEQHSNWALLIKKKFDGLNCPRPGPKF